MLHGQYFADIYRRSDLVISPFLCLNFRHFFHISRYILVDFLLLLNLDLHLIHSQLRLYSRSIFTIIWNRFQTYKQMEPENIQNMSNKVTMHFKKFKTYIYIYSKFVSFTFYKLKSCTSINIKYFPKRRLRGWGLTLQIIFGKRSIFFLKVLVWHLV